MHLRLLDSGTMMDVKIQPNDENAPEMEFQAKFVDIEDDVFFYISGKKLVAYFRERNEPCAANIIFFVGADVYSFEARLEKSFVKSNGDVINARITSPITKGSRRKSLRIETNTDVNLYKMEKNLPNMMGEYVGSGTMFDISEGGLCFLSNDKMKLDKEQDYISAFPLYGSPMFYMHVILIRSGNSPQSAHFKNDHAFKFGEETNKQQIQDLAYAALRHKMR